MPDPSLSALRGGEADSTFTPHRFALIQLLVLLILYPGLVVGSRSLFFRDFGQYGYPNAQFLRDSFWQADLPLWNPLSSCGIPFLAQWNTMTLHPGSLVFVLLPMPWSLNLFCVSQLFLGGLGMFCLARRWTSDGFAATVAGLLYSTNGIAMNAVMWPSIVSAMAFAPWVVGAALSVAGGRPGAVPGAVVLSTLQLLTGGVEVVVATWLVIGALSVDIFLGRQRPGLRGILGLAAIIVWVSLLSAVQLLPFLQFLGGSERTESSTGSFSSMPLTGWANFLVPSFGTLRTQAGLPFQPGQVWLTSYYLGAGSVALALLGALARPRRRTLLLAGSALFCLFLALGEHGGLYSAVKSVFPAVTVLRYPVKFVLPLLLLVPLLVVHGLEHCRTAARGGRPIPNGIPVVFALVATAIVFLAVAAPYAQKSSDLVTATRWNALLRLGFLCFAGIILVGALRTVMPGRRTALQVAFLAIGFLDLLTHAPTQAPTVASDTFLMRMDQHRKMTQKPQLGISRAMLSPQALALFDRTHLANSAQSYLGLRLGLYMNCNLLEQIPKVDGFFPLLPKHHARLNSHLAQPGAIPDPLADFLAVSQITAPDSVTEWRERTTALPWVTGGQKPVTSEDLSTLTQLLQPDFAPRQVVFVDPSDAPAFATAQAGKPELRLDFFKRHHIRIHCRTDQTNVVVVAQNHDPGWKARLDQRPVPLYRANLAFQSILVPPGDHEIELIYRSDPFLLGLALSLLSTAPLAWAMRRGTRQCRLPSR